MSIEIGYSHLQKIEKSNIVNELLIFLDSFCKSDEDLNELLKDIHFSHKNRSLLLKKVSNFDSNDSSTSTSIIKKEEINVGCSVVSNMKNLKKEERIIGFDDLSPNTVVYNILPFYEMKCGLVGKQYDCFGYFKKDRLRNIWYLFLSLKISTTTTIEDDLHVEEDREEYATSVRLVDGFTSFYINLERLRYLSVHENCGKTGEIYEFSYQKFLNEINFKNLISLKINFRNSILPEERFLEESFGILKKLSLNNILKNSKFGKLKYLDYQVTRSNNTGNEIIDLTNMKGMKRIKLCNQSGKWKIKSLGRNTKTLKYLYLLNISLAGYEKWGDLNYVEILKFRYTKPIYEQVKNDVIIKGFFKYHKFKNLKRFYGVGDFCDFQFGCVNLKVLSIQTFSAITDNFFKQNSFNSVEKLVLSDIDQITGKGWNEMKSLKSIAIFRCSSFEDPKLFSNKNIERLTCQDCDLISGIMFKNQLQRICLVELKKSYEVVIKKLLKLMIRLTKIVKFDLDGNENCLNRLYFTNSFGENFSYNFFLQSNDLGVDGFDNDCEEFNLFNIIKTFK